MFVSILLALAMSGASAVPDVVDEPDKARSIVIPLVRYDLNQARDVDRLKFRIRTAARSVCDQGYRGVMYLQTAECMRNAVAGANAQLGKLAQRQSDTAVAAAIAVTSK